MGKLSIILVTAVSFNVYFVTSQQTGSAGLGLDWLSSANNFLNGFDRVNSISSNSDFGAATGDEAKADTVRFFLYTDNSSRFAPDELIHNNEESLWASRFNTNHPVKFFIHGFGAEYNCTFPQDIKDIYLNKGLAINVVLVDWKLLAAFRVFLEDVPGLILSTRIMSDYYEAVGNSAIVGRRIGDFINFLSDHGFTTLPEVHVVGFSLGAHAAGYAGRRAMDIMGAKIGRITGLDPASPMYQSGLFGTSLSKNDAVFVDIIHTDMGQAGTSQSLGHANFFMNGGHAPQPSCQNDFDQNVSVVNVLIKWIYAFIGVCSHNAATLYYAQSILSNILTRKCVERNPMLQQSTSYGFQPYCWSSRDGFGDKISLKASGNYYVKLYPMEPSGIYNSCYPYPY